MDPNAALLWLEDAFAEGDYDDVCDQANDLIDWLERGGSIPSRLGLIRELAIDHVKAMQRAAIDKGGLPYGSREDR